MSSPPAAQALVAWSMKPRPRIIQATRAWATVVALFACGCGGSAPTPVPSGSVAIDGYAIAEAAPPGFTLTDAMPQRPRITKDQLAESGEFPLTPSNRDCPELPAASSSQPFESIVDPPSTPTAELNEVTLNGLVAEECQLWRDRFAVFSKLAPSKRIGQPSHEFQVTRFDSQSWQKDAELSIPALDSVWDLSADGRWLLGQRRSTNHFSALAKGRTSQRSVDLWDFSSAKFVASWEPYGDQRDESATIVVGAAMVSDDEAVTCSAAGEMVWWKLPDCKAVRRIQHFGTATFVMTPGRRFVGVFDGVTFCFYDARTGTPKGRLEDRHRHFLSIRSAGLSSSGEELLAWANYSGLTILMRWSLRDGRLLNFMPVPGTVGEGLQGVRWLRPPFALIGDWVADLTANRFVGKIGARPNNVRQALNGPDGRLWIHTPLNRLFPVDLPNEEWLIAADGGSLAPLPLGPLAKIKINVQIPTKPADVPDFESELVTSLASQLKSWGTKIAADGTASLAVELDFKSTGNTIEVAIQKHELMRTKPGTPIGSLKLPEYLLTGTVRLTNETGQLCGQLRQSLSSVHIDLNNYPVKGDALLHHDLQVMTWNGWLRKFDQQIAQILQPRETDWTSLSMEEYVRTNPLAGLNSRVMFPHMGQASHLRSPAIEWKPPETKELALSVPAWNYGSQAAPVVAQANPGNVAGIGNTPAVPNNIPANNVAGVSTPAAGATGQREKDPILTAPRYSSASTLAISGVKSLVMPSPPRIHFATCCTNGSFQTWDPRTLKVFRSARHDEGVECIGFADSGNSLVYATTDRRIRLYDLNGRTQTANVPVGEKFVRMLCTATGGSMAVGTEDGKVLAFRVSSRGADSQRTLCKCDGLVTGLRWADDSEKLLAISSADGKCRFVNFKTGELKQTLDPNAGGLLGVDVSPDGNLAAVATFRDGVHVFNLDTNEVTQKFDSGRATFAVGFSKDGELLVSGGDNGRILAWKLSDRQATWSALGLAGKVQELHFSDDGLGLAAVSEAGSVYVWNLSQPPRSR